MNMKSAENCPPVDYRMLSKVIVGSVGMNESAAEELALRMLNYFGYEEEVIDNMLDQEDRRLFYFLQDLKLLKTHWEEAVLPSGRTWRIFYWKLNADHICREVRKLEENVDEIVSLYETLPENAWSRERPEVAAE